MASEHPSIEYFDWRVRALAVTAQDFISPSGRLVRAGTPVQGLGFAQLEGSGVFFFRTPDPSAIYLSLANKEFRKAIEYREKMLPTAVQPSSEAGWVTINDKADTGFFDYLESLTAAVVFSYTAIEVFANYMMPEDYSFRMERNDKRCTEEYSKEQIERYLNLDTKLDRVLPPICGVDSPKGTQKWERYVKLKSLRDRLIHLKTDDWQAAQPEKARDCIWTSLLSEETSEVSSFAFDMICHYLPPEKARWVHRYPNPPVTESSTTKATAIGVGWVERSETHQRSVVGLATLDPPYSYSHGFPNAGLSK